MSVFVDKDSKVIIQGFTGQHATFHAEEAMTFGTKIVGRRDAGQGRHDPSRAAGVQLVAEAVEETGATVSGIFVPPAIATDSLLEAVEAGIQIAVIIADGVPVQDMVRTKRYLAGPLDDDHRAELARHHHAGRVQGRHHAEPHLPAGPGRGRVALAARSNYEAVAQMTALGLGQSTCVGIGGDPVNGTDFKTVLQAFENDDDTDVVVMIGEIGGQQEVEAAALGGAVHGEAARRLHRRRVGAARPADGPRRRGDRRRLGHRQREARRDRGLGHRVVRNPAEIGDTVLRAVKEAGDRVGAAS